MKKIKINTSRFRSLFIISLAVYALIPFLVLMLYNHPSSDDFTYANEVLEKGFFSAQYHWYVSWSGRYIGTAILSLNPIVFHSFLGYKVFALLLFSLLVYAFYFLLNQLFEKESIFNKILIMLLFLIVYFYQMPRVVSGIYWLAGSATYQLGNIFSLFMFGNIIKYLKAKETKYLIYTVLFLFLLVGTNETTMFLTGIILFFIMIIFHFDKQKIKFKFIKQKNYIFIILVLLAFIFSLIVILSPGNEIRSGFFPDKHKLNSFNRAYHLARTYIIQWIPVLTIFSILALSLIKKPFNANARFFKTNPFVSLLIMIFITYIGFFPAFWSMGEEPPLRTINVIYFFFILTWLYFSMTLYVYFRNDKATSIPKFIIYILMFAVIAIMSKPNNIKNAYRDWLNGTAQRYDQQMKKRYQIIKKQIEQKKEKDALIVPHLKDIPKTIYFRDISSDNIKNWRNASYAKFWKISSIKTQEKK